MTRHLATEILNNSIKTTFSRRRISARAPSNPRRDTYPFDSAQKRMIKKPRGNGPSYWALLWEESHTVLSWIEWLKPLLYFSCVSHVRDEGHLPPDLLPVHYNGPLSFSFHLFTRDTKGVLSRDRGVAYIRPIDENAAVAWPAGRPCCTANNDMSGTSQPATSNHWHNH